MPQLKNLSCSIEWSESGAAFQEYGTLYGDGVVETFIVVPNRPQSFTVRIRSRGFIYEGLAAVIFTDGNYQTNRNRVNLIPSAKGQSRLRTEVDFLIRQKEKPLGGGMYMGREWRFDDHNIIEELPDGVNGNHFDNLGMIEVLVLRCRARLPDEAPASPVSSGADSDMFCERTSNVGVDVAVETTAPVQEIEEVDGFMGGIFDGTGNGPNIFGLDGSVPPPGNEWQGYSQHFTPRRTANINNDGHYNSFHTMPYHQTAAASHSMSHPGPAAPKPGRHVHFDFGPQGPPSSLHGPEVDPVESRPPSYDRHRYSVLPPNTHNSTLGYPPQSFPMKPPCRYPLTQCQCGLPHHSLDPRFNRYSDAPIPMWSTQVNSYPQGHANILQPLPIYPSTVVPTVLANPIIGQQQYPHAMLPYNEVPSYGQRPGTVHIPYYLPTSTTWPNQQPYSVPPTNNGNNPKAGHENQQQQQTEAGKQQNPQVSSNTDWTNSTSGSSNNQINIPNDQSNQPLQQITNSNDNTGTAWDENRNAANGESDWANGNGNSNGQTGSLANADSNDNDANGDKWAVSNDNNNDHNNTSNGGDNDWASKTNNTNRNDGNDQKWGMNDNDDANKNNHGTWDSTTNNKAVNDNGTWNEANNQSQDNTKQDINQNAQDLADPKLSQLLSSSLRPLFGPHGQYYTWEPKGVDAPSPDAEEEPRYDVPKRIADMKGVSKQVQPGQGYLYCKKRSVPEYIDDMNEPYARFVFKYRTKEQVKNELGIEIETEPTGDESIQELQNLDKQVLIDMLIRAKSALGGKVPSPSPKPTTPCGEMSADQKMFVPVEPPIHDFLKYQMPSIRMSRSIGKGGDPVGADTPQNTNADNEWASDNPNGNGNSRQWNDQSAGDSHNGWNCVEGQQNNGTGWDGVAEKNSGAHNEAWASQGENHNHQSQGQSRTQNRAEPNDTTISVPPTPPPPAPPHMSSSAFTSSGVTDGRFNQLQSGGANNAWDGQNINSTVSSPASIHPPYNPANGNGKGWNQLQQAGVPHAKDPTGPHDAQTRQASATFW